MTSNGGLREEWFTRETEGNINGVGFYEQS
jgi:hypothetical protein